MMLDRFRSGSHLHLKVRRERNATERGEKTNAVQSLVAAQEDEIVGETDYSEIERSSGEVIAVERSAGFPALRREGPSTGLPGSK